MMRLDRPEHSSNCSRKETTVNKTSNQAGIIDKDHMVKLVIKEERKPSPTSSSSIDRVVLGVDHGTDIHGVTQSWVMNKSRL